MTEGAGQLVITSVLGQTILIRKMDSQTTLKMPPNRISLNWTIPLGNYGLLTQ